MWKLLKHNLNSSKKKYLIMFAVFLGICIISPLSNFLVFYGSSQNQEISLVFYSLFTSMFFMGLFVIAILVALYSYKDAIRSLFSKQGYLTFTLPYKPSQIIVSKMLTALIWQTAFTLLAILGGLIMFALNYLILSPVIGEINFEYPLQIISDMFALIASIEGEILPWRIVISILSFIVSIPLSSIIIFLSFTLINSSAISSNSKNIAILLVFGFSYGLSFISSILGVIFGFVEPTILPMIVQLLINIAAVVGGYKWLVYLLEYRLELS